MANPRSESSRLSEVVWFGLALVVLGVFTPETLMLGGTKLSRVLFYSGVGVLLVSVLVAVVRWADAKLGASSLGTRERD
ncbi:hypothetical protein [Halobaculum marinum]|uniref:Uncharacterized protein n=1 Tax=Halobaculum marinum TaxID=3031996 RepID=A0ABD5WSA6_9EURY|nr:hypothetical protein [Halobaculum sp. DT55]